MEAESLIDRRNGVAAWKQIADRLSGAIAAGEYDETGMVPPETQLAERFGVNRHTVRRALSVLAEEGVVRAEHGRGTFVSSVPDTSRRLKVETTLAELAEMYRDTQPKMLDIEPLSSPPPLDPGDGTPAAAYMHMRRVHAHDDRPYNVISIFLARDIFDLAPEDFRTRTVVTVLQELPTVRIAQARQTLTISTADVEVAGLLGIPINSPVADVRRVFCDASGRVIYIGLITYRGDFIRLEMDLQP